MNIYDFTVKLQNGKEISLSQFRGKVLLIVNTATHCTFTPQYEKLQTIYDEHIEDGFEILDFPCNQFGERAPETDGEIASFCMLNYGVMFPQFAKIEVNGEHADPLFRWLAENSKFRGLHGLKGMMLAKQVKKQDKDYASNNKIKWNFTKFLIDRNGEIVKRFEPTVNMREVKKQIELLL